MVEQTTHVNELYVPNLFLDYLNLMSNKHLANKYMYTQLYNNTNQNAMHPEINPADTNQRAPRDRYDDPPVHRILVPIHGVQ